MYYTCIPWKFYPFQKLAHTHARIYLSFYVPSQSRATLSSSLRDGVLCLGSAWTHNASKVSSESDMYIHMYMCAFEVWLQLMFYYLTTHTHLNCGAQLAHLLTLLNGMYSRCVLTLLLVLQVWKRSWVLDRFFEVEKKFCDSCVTTYMYLVWNWATILWMQGNLWGQP